MSSVWSQPRASQPGCTMASLCGRCRCVHEWKLACVVGGNCLVWEEGRHPLLELSMRLLFPGALGHRMIHRARGPTVGVACVPLAGQRA